jgi:hypothetical protein
MALPPSGATPAISYLVGEVHALFMISQVLATAYPDLPYLLSQFDAIEQAGLANVESQPLADSAIDGYRFAMAGVRRAVERAAANRPKANPASEP